MRKDNTSVGCPPLLRVEYVVSRYNPLRIFPLRIVSETEKTFILAKHDFGEKWYTQRAVKDRLTRFPTFEAAKAEVIRRAEKRLESAKAAIPVREKEVEAAKALIQDDSEPDAWEV